MIGWLHKCCANMAGLIEIGQLCIKAIVSLSMCAGSARPVCVHVALYYRQHRFIDASQTISRDP